MENFVIFLVTIVGLLSYLCYRRLSYFERKNVPYLKSFPFIGALTDALIGRKGIYDCIEDIYYNPKFKNDKFFGIFMFHKPALFIKDQELIKRILVKDFNSFVNHRSASDVHDPLGNNNLFMAKDSLWRNLRKKLTPFFTSGKMKQMFPILDHVSDNLVAHFEENLSSKSSIEVRIKEKMCLFTTDVIASVAYGVDAKSLKNPDGEFAKFSRLLFGLGFRRSLEFTAGFLLPEVMKFFGFYVFTPEGTKFVTKSMKHVISEREKSKTKRNDLIDTLIEIKNTPKDANEQQLPIETLIAQAALFFSAGHETSAGTATFMLYELAKHPDIQDRVRNELYEALKKNDGKLTYDIVMHETPYLHQVLLETLRLFPVLPLLDRECSNPNGYSLPDSDFVIPHKMPVYIPIFGIQRDEKFFPNALKFDPERFSPENIKKVPEFTNMPFGMGGRNCIGERFGQMQAKIGVIKLLMNYRADMTPETPKEIKIAKNSFVIQSEVPIVLRFVKDEMKF